MAKILSKKHGKHRMYARRAQKKPAAAKAKAQPKVPYVRAGRTGRVRTDRLTWRRSLQDIITASDYRIIRMLREDGILRDFANAACPRCHKGTLTKLQNFGARGWRYRCRRKGCQHFILPHHDHPIFNAGWGKEASTLQDQAAALMCAVSHASLTTTSTLLQKNDKMVRSVFQRLDSCRRAVVERDQKRIVFGNLIPWNDVEADEVDLGKKDTGSGAKAPVKWEQWGGLVERGDPKTLVLTRLNPKLTKLRAPGPGPITKTDWAPIARKYLKNKKVVLHTDGAKSYRLKATPVAGVVHDWVVHQKKKVTIRGKAVWVQPRYVKLFQHTCPDGTMIRAQGGTQIIDRAWQFIRKHLGNRSLRVDNANMTDRVRSAQWVYWHRGADLWLSTGQMLQTLWT